MLGSFFGSFLEYFEFWLTNYGQLGVSGVFFMAQVIPPISTELLGMFTGFLYLQGIDVLSWKFFNALVFKVSIPAALGVTIGSLLIFYIGYFLGKPFIEKWGKFIMLSWGDIEKIQRKFESSNTDEIGLFALRVIPFFPSVSISFFSGIVRMKIKTYIIFTFLGTFVRVILLSVIGLQAGGILNSYSSIFKSFEGAGTLLIILGIILFIFYKNKKIKKHEE